MRHLVTLRDGFEAKVLAARLGSEGVLVELRGSVDGPYPLGQIHVYVEESGLETARTVLALSEAAEAPEEHDAEDALEAWDDEDAALGRRVRERRRLLAVVAVGMVAVLVLLELLRHAGAEQRSQPPVPAGVSASPAAMDG
jgi:hypothetical protein